MRVYLSSGDVVSTEADARVTRFENGEHALVLLDVPDSSVIRYWHPQEEEWYDCRWDLDRGSPNYGQLYYEGSETRE